MHYSFLSIAPALIVLILGLTTKRILLSLLCGIATACAIASAWNPIASIQLFFLRVWQTAELSNLSSWKYTSQSSTLLILLFLSCLGVLISLLEYSGGAAAYTQTIQKRLATQAGAEGTSVLLSASFFIDDYFSILTVGSIMRPLSDKFRIPRAKLSFLIDSMAAPVSVLSPISSWIAVMIGQLEKTGITSQHTASQTIIASPSSVYIQTIPFIMYSFILIASLWFIIYGRISFGPMRTHEFIAEKTGNLFGGKSPLKQTNNPREPYDHQACIIDFFVPIASFLASVICCLLYTGSFDLFGGTRSFFDAIQNGSSSLALAGGSALATLITMAFLTLRNKIAIDNLAHVCYKGLLVMLPSQLILLLSWTLGSLLRVDLLAGDYLASSFIGNVPVILLPLFFFVITSATSFAMGSSWGTLAIVTPIAIPLLLNLTGTITPTYLPQIPELFPLLGAILSGALLGDHISPMSDYTIMSSASAGAYHHDHLDCQSIYTIPIFIGCCIAFFLAGILVRYDVWLSCIVSTLVSSGFTLLLFAICNRARLALAYGEKHGESEE